MTYHVTQSIYIIIIAIPKNVSHVSPNYLALGFFRGRTIAPSGLILCRSRKTAPHHRGTAPALPILSFSWLSEQGKPIARLPLNRECIQIDPLADILRACTGFQCSPMPAPSFLVASGSLTD